MDTATGDIESAGENDRLNAGNAEQLEDETA
jgi:hypothetical protein